VADYGRLEWSPRMAVSMVIGIQHRMVSAAGFITSALAILAYPLGNSPSYKVGETNGFVFKEGKDILTAEGLAFMHGPVIL